LSADLSADHIETFADRAVHEGAAIALAPLVLDRSGHLLREETDAAAAIERHAELAVRRRTGEVAGELGALVLAGDDLARPGPLTPDVREEALVLVRCNGGTRRADQENRGGDGYKSGKSGACSHGDTDRKNNREQTSELEEEWLTLRLHPALSPEWSRRGIGASIVARSGISR